MKNFIFEIPELFRGKFVVNIPSSKSIANRCVHLASLSSGISKIHGDFEAEDIKRMISVWSDLGAKFQNQNGVLSVKGCGGKIISNNSNIYVGQAGTVARFITALLMLDVGKYYLYGDTQINNRPMADLFNAMKLITSFICTQKEGCLPVYLSKTQISLQKYNIKLNANKSSQFLSAIIMACVGLNKAANIYIDGVLVSEPYVDMTINIIKKFSGKLKKIDDYYQVNRTQKGLQAVEDITLEPDLSSASYFLALAAINGSEISFPGIFANSLQGDIAFLHILEKMGCYVDYNKTGVVVRGPTSLNSIDVDMINNTDLVPALCVVAMFAKGISYLRNISHMRYKECNRIEALIKEVSRLGGEIKYINNKDIYIKGKKLYQGRVCKTYSDHRIAMALSIAGTKIKGVSIEDPLCIAKSYPNFIKTLTNLKPQTNHNQIYLN